MATSFPALLLMEYGSVPEGIAAADAMAKRAPLGLLRLGTVQPGKFLVLATGEVEPMAEARAAADAVAEALDRVLLADVHPAVVEALTQRSERAGEALGVIETRTVASLLQVADAGVKGAEVRLATLRLADGLGGKGYLLFSGLLHEVEAAMQAGVGGLPRPDQGLKQATITQLDDTVWDNLAAAPMFRDRLEDTA